MGSDVGPLKRWGHHDMPDLRLRLRGQSIKQTDGTGERAAEVGLVRLGFIDYNEPHPALILSYALLEPNSGLVETCKRAVGNELEHLRMGCGQGMIQGHVKGINEGNELDLRAL